MVVRILSNVLAIILCAFDGTLEILLISFAVNVVSLTMGRLTKVSILFAKQSSNFLK